MATTTTAMTLLGPPGDAASIQTRASSNFSLIAHETISMTEPPPEVVEALSRSTIPIPPLPPLRPTDHDVNKRGIIERVYTHASLPDSNTVLASLGSQLLCACVTEWLIAEDAAVQLEELEIRLDERVNPGVLAAYTDAYNLHKLLVYAKTFPEEERFSTAARVNVFLAYVGGLHQSHGYETVRAWIFELMDWDNESVLKSLQD